MLYRAYLALSRIMLFRASYHSHPRFFLSSAFESAPLFPLPTIKMGESYTYVLGLKGSNFYVGTTINLKRRFLEHIRGKSSALWVKMHGMECILEIRKGGTQMEKQTTLEYMRRYGVEKVRGGYWRSINLKNDPLNSISACF
jgi:predicted GIY-YIG superfamily endonuclease